MVLASPIPGVTGEGAPLPDQYLATVPAGAGPTLPAPPPPWLAEAWLLPERAAPGLAPLAWRLWGELGRRGPQTAGQLAAGLPWVTSEDHALELLTVQRNRAADIALIGRRAAPSEPANANDRKDAAQH